MKVETSKIIGFGVGTLVSTGVITGLWAYSDTDDAYRLHDTQEEVATLENVMEENDHNMLRLEQRLGESCITALTVYLPGQTLEETPENTVVDDVVDLPSKPCSDNRTNVRTATRGLTDTTNAQIMYNQALTDSKKKLEGRLSDQSDKQWPNGLVMSAVLAPLVGIGLAGFNSRAKKYTNKPRFPSW